MQFSSQHRPESDAGRNRKPVEVADIGRKHEKKNLFLDVASAMVFGPRHQKTQTENQRLKE